MRIIFTCLIDMVLLLTVQAKLVFKIYFYYF
jgi:hypothetical protein